MGLSQLKLMKTTFNFVIVQLEPVKTKILTSNIY